MHIESIIVAELDKAKGYYFLKRMKLNLPAKICNVFDSNETSSILLLIQNGDLFTLNLETEAFLRIAESPAGPSAKVRTSEISHQGRMISVATDNRQFFIYQIEREKSRLFTILTNPSKIKQMGQQDPLSHFFFKNTLQLGRNLAKQMANSLLSTYQTDKSLRPLHRTAHPASVLNFPDNLSYKSFVPEEFDPVAILSSSEDPLLVHRNIVHISAKSRHSSANTRPLHRELRPRGPELHRPTHAATRNRHQRAGAAEAMLPSGQLHRDRVFGVAVSVPQARVLDSTGRRPAALDSRHRLPQNSAHLRPRSAVAVPVRGERDAGPDLPR